jgi:hypothetical protein
MKDQPQKLSEHPFFKNWEGVEDIEPGKPRNFRPVRRSPTKGEYHAGLRSDKPSSQPPSDEAIDFFVRLHQDPLE